MRFVLDDKNPHQTYDKVDTEIVKDAAKKWISENENIEEKIKKYINFLRKMSFGETLEKLLVGSVGMKNG